MPAAMPSHRFAEDADVCGPAAQKLLLLSAALACGWRVERKVGDQGSSVLEVFDATGGLMGFAASTPRCLLSIDAAWRGVTWDQDGRRHWWAIAVGHAPRDTGLRVSFARRRRNGVVQRTQAALAGSDGLWMAVGAGLQTTVSLRQGRQHLVHRVSATVRTPASTSVDGHGLRLRTSQLPRP
jgi:hypothetical protein